jgi:hypothetical protein
MSNVSMMAADQDSGARKVGTYDIPEDRPKGSQTPPPPPPEKKGSLNWLWWLLGLLLALVLLAWLFQSCMPAATPTNEAVNTPAAAVPAEGDAAGAVAGDTTALCTAITDYDGISAEAPAITAETPVADVRSYNDRVQAAGAALTSGAAAVPDLDVSAVGASLGALGNAVAGLTGDVVGDAADSLNAAFAGVTTSYGELRTAAACQ